MELAGEAVTMSSSSGGATNTEIKIYSSGRPLHVQRPAVAGMSTGNRCNNRILWFLLFILTGQL